MASPLSGRLLAGLLLAGLAAAQCRPVSPPSGAAPPPAVEAEVEGIALGTVGTDRAQLALTLRLRSRRAATVENLRFANLEVNGLPVFASPVTQTMHLAAGASTPLPEPLRVSVYYRDLDSLQPLIALVQTGQAHIQGTADLEADLNPLEKIVLASRHATVVSDFENDVPVAVPGGLPLRLAAVAALGAANQALQSAVSDASSAAARFFRERRELAAAYRPALLRVQTDFTLDQGGGQSAAYTCSGLGFRIAADRALAPQRLVHPWAYDAALAEAMQHQHARLIAAAYGLQDAPAGSLRILALAPQPPQTVFLPEGGGRPVRIHLQAAAAPANLALLALPAEPAAVPRLDTTDGPGHWDELASFRLRPGQAAPEIFFVAAQRQGDAILLADPVDASAWGAPLIGPNGIVGMIQDESTAVSLAAATRLLAAAPAH
jgi:hypothetical protein